MSLSMADEGKEMGVGVIHDYGDMTISQSTTNFGPYGFFF